MLVPVAGSAAAEAGRGLATGIGPVVVGVGSACGVVLGAGVRAAGGSDCGEGEGAVFCSGAACCRAGCCACWRAGACVAAGADAVPLLPPAPLAWKYLTHSADTLFGSRWYCSYISSTSHSLAPKSVVDGAGSELEWPEDCGTVGFASSGVRARVGISDQG